MDAVESTTPEQGGNRDQLVARGGADASLSHGSERSEAQQCPPRQGERCKYEPTSSTSRIISATLIKVPVMDTTRASRWARLEDGTNSWDSVRAVVIYADGSSILAGETWGNWSTTNAGGYDFMAVKLDINGSLLWEWQNGTEDWDYMYAAAGADDGSVIFAGNTYGSYGAENAGSADFVAVKIDTDGNTIWAWQDGTDGVDYVRDSTMSDDGSVVLVGSTEGNWSTTNAGSLDCVAIKLNANGTVAWTWQGGTEEDDYCNGVAMADDGSVIVAGHTYGDWSEVNAGSSDFVAVKLNVAGEEGWVWQDGTSGDDHINAAVATGDGSAVLAGYTSGLWKSTTDSSKDFAAVKLDFNGTVQWRWQEGSSEDDAIGGAAARNGGDVVLVGTSQGNWSKRNKGKYDFAAVELDSDGTALWRWQDGTAYEDYTRAVATTGDDRVLLAGHTYGTWSGVSVGYRDFAAVLLERPTTTPSSATTTPTPTPSAAAGSPSAATSTVTWTTSSPVTTTPTLPPSIAEGSSSSAATSTVTWTMTVVAAVAILVLAGWIWRRNKRRKGEGSQAPRSVDTTQNPEDNYSTGNPANSWGSANPVHSDAPPLYNSMFASGGGPVGEIIPAPIAPPAAAFESTNPKASVGHGYLNEFKSGDDQDHVIAENHFVETTSKTENSARLAALVTVLPPNVPRADHDSNNTLKNAAEDVTGLADNSSSSESSLHSGISVAEVVMEAAIAVAHSSSIPGVPETAMLVSLLVKLVVDHRDNDAIVDRRVRWCRSIVSVLKRASELFGKGNDGAIGDAERYLLEDVHDSVNNLVGIMQTYKAKGKMSKLFVSSLFSRRQEEAEVVIKNAISSLQLGLQVHSGHNLASLGHGLTSVGQNIQEIKAALEAPGQLPEVSATQFAHQVKVESRREKRQRRLQKLEITKDQLTLTDVLLGKGGFGEVYLADFSGINAAAKVLQIEPDQQQDAALHEDEPFAIGNEERSHKAGRHKMFLRELQAMTRLKSPHTVHVYGAITSRKDLVIVMELMPGGDLCTLLQEADGLPETRQRDIMRDICFGMAFLHSEGAIHGDLKSANVLFDSAGMPKIADFGTARWTQHLATTGLATTFMTMKSNGSTQMSIPWAAPEVLDNDDVTFESDVYSFGIVAWEIVSGKKPWANFNARAIFKRVVLAGERPEIPSDTAADVAEVIRFCWEENPRERPTFNKILDTIKSWVK